MGAQIGNVHLQGTWKRHQKRWHINRKELFAVYQTIYLQRNRLKGKAVLLQSVNRTVISYIRNQGGTKSAPLLDLTNRLLTLTSQLGMSLIAHYIPSNYNSIADNLSRQKNIPDWHLSKVATRKIFKVWGTPQVDLFASKLSKVVPVYVSRDSKDTEALYIYAFSQKWFFWLAWIFPPPCLISQVLNHLNQAKGTYILIAPKWEWVFWQADLMSRATAPPIPIQNLRQHLMDVTTGYPLPKAHLLNLEAWRIQGGLG